MHQDRDELEHAADLAREERERDDALIDRFARDDWAAFQRDVEQGWRLP